MSCMPPWVPSFTNCVRNVSPVLFTFSSVSKDGFPHARTCVFRSFLFDDRNTGVLVFTTDRRMSKVEELTSSDGKFEACFYFAKERCQFRFSGFAQLLTQTQRPTMRAEIPSAVPLGTPSSSPSSLSSSSSSFYPVFTPSFRVGELYDEEFPPPTEEEWRAEYERVWHGMSPELKSSFRKPTPGTLLTDNARKRIDSIARGVDGASEESGKENFVVVLMFVNTVDLYDNDQEKRTLFTRTKEDVWVEQDVCP
ncbi:hypothetical protein TRVA0_004S02542 [Trichomonascus vanleenenianus]|uniref:uncharacterized protein n=1 Tax=Trichomonascus vanleenenianus TaxID=2268995 RepID=UPI003ECA7124